MSSIFRKEVIENFNEENKEFKNVSSINIKFIVAIAVLLVSTLFFVYWLLFGSINQTVSVKCVVWPFEKSGSVYATTEGEITKMMVEKGTIVSTGDVIAIIPQEDLLRKIKELKNEDPVANQEKIEDLKNEYIKQSLIRANKTGIVTYAAEDHNFVNNETKIAEIMPVERRDNIYKLLSYIPVSKKGLISIGMDVQITPDYLSRTENGFIYGYVSDVSELYVKGEEIKETDEILYTNDIDPMENYLRMEITLLPDDKNSGNYKWSRKESSDIKLVIGTLCDGDIIINKSNPFNWLF